MQVDDELDFLALQAPLADAEVIELGCGAAALARSLVSRYPGARVTGLEIDARQHAANLRAPLERLTFVEAGAQSIPFEANRFDLAVMLKSLHHVPGPLLDQALSEAWRVLKPNGLLYVSEPVFGGPLNEIIRLFNDEQVVRAHAQAALDRALTSGRWSSAGDVRLDMPITYRSFEEFERKSINVTFADRRLAPEVLAAVRARFETHLGEDGASFLRPLHVRMLRKVA